MAYGGACEKLIIVQRGHCALQIWKTFFEAAAGLRLGGIQDPGSDDGELENEEDSEAVQPLRRETQSEEDQEGDVTARLDTRPRSASDSSSGSSQSTSTPNTTIRQSSGTPEEAAAPQGKPGRTKKSATASAEARPPTGTTSPTVEPSWADDHASPFEQLRQDIEKVKVSSDGAASSSGLTHDASSASSAMLDRYAPPALKSEGFRSAGPSKDAGGHRSERQQAQTRLRDLSMDSPDFARPALETMSFPRPRASLYLAANEPRSKGKERSNDNGGTSYSEQSTFSSSSAYAASPASTLDFPSPASSSSSSPPSRAGHQEQQARPSMARRQSSGKGANQLLAKVLRKSMVGKDGRPNASTPARKGVKGIVRDAQAAGEQFYPQGVHAGWNGIADLSRTPLSSFDSPQRSTISKFEMDMNEFEWDRRSSGSARKARGPTSESPQTSPPGEQASLDDYGRPDALLASGGRTPRRTARAHATEPNQHGTPGLERSGKPRNDSFADLSGVGRFHPPAFSVSRSRLTKTPAKEAARLITRDVLQRAALRNNEDMDAVGVDSPALEPPSVVKNWATRGYGAAAAGSPDPGYSPAGRAEAAADDLLFAGPAAGHGQGALLAEAEEGEESFEAEFEALPPRQPNFGHLADEGDELGSSQGAPPPFADQERPGLVAGDNEWEDSFEDSGRGGEGDSFDDEQAARAAGIAYEETEVPIRGEGGETSFNSDEGSRSFGEGEEETVFGAKAAAARLSQPGPGYAAYGAGDQEGVLEGEEGQRGFQLRGLDDMVTLHGGVLLESQPFDASPLAGRDARYGL